MYDGYWVYLCRYLFGEYRQSRATGNGLSENCKQLDMMLLRLLLSRLNRFAGNMLEVKALDGALYLCLSQSAYNVLSVAQRIQLARHVQLFNNPDTYY